MWSFKRDCRQNVDIPKELIIDKDIADIIQIDILRSCDPYGDQQIPTHTSPWIYSGSSSEREAEDEMVRQHS